MLSGILNLFCSLTNAATHLATGTPFGQPIKVHNVLAQFGFGGGGGGGGAVQSARAAGAAPSMMDSGMQSRPQPAQRPAMQPR